MVGSQDHQTMSDRQDRGHPTALTAAAVQMVSGTDAAANLAAADRLIGRAAGQGAALVVLPEVFGWLGGGRGERDAIAEPPGDGPIQAFLGEAARRWGVWLVGGTVLLRSPDGRAHAASLLLDPQGHVAARYDKIHLFDVSLPDRGETYRESDYTCPGTRTVCADAAGARVGLTVCYDVRFPELYRALAKAGAQILTVPSAFTASTGAAHWDVLLRARAVENLAFVVAPAQGGRHPNGRETYGHSAIVDPWGTVLACRGEPGEGVVLARLDLARQAQRRRRFPVLDHRRL